MQIISELDTSIASVGDQVVWSIRLKNIELGFTLPESLFKTNSVDTRLYLSGLNLLNISSFNLWDSEMGGNGLGYPPQRVINVGLQLNF